MKKLLLFLICALVEIPAFADLGGDGYYRVQNAVSKRYAYLTDNKGKFDPATTSADVQALQLWKDYTRMLSDPATVFYINKVSAQGSNLCYNVANQGTSIYGFLGEYLRILKGKEYGGQQAYYAYASKSGFTKYLGDLRTDSDDDRGAPSVDAKGDDRLWYIHPVSAESSDSYFGVAPTVTAGGKYYYPMYAGFPYSAYSEGVKFYSVTKVDAEFEVVVLKELSGYVPASTAVIIECDHPLPADNRLNIGQSGTAASMAGNLLKGVYFDNDMNTHWNRTAYNKATMRTLASVNGVLRFVTASLDYLPANQAYLSLSGDAQTSVESYRVIKESEYDAYKASISSHNPDGYYRMRNVATSRYAYLLDDKGAIGASPDVEAFQLWQNAEQYESDPACVFEMTRPDGAGVFERNLTAQGANTVKMYGVGFKVSPAEADTSGDTYYVSAMAGGVRNYLGDNVDAGSDRGQMSVSASGDACKWKFEPVGNSSGNWFGVVPSVSVNGSYYKPFMAGFPIAAASEGVRFLIIEKVDPYTKKMVYSEIKGVVPSGVPVIIECAGPYASDNRLTVGASGEDASVSSNLLQGAWFDNQTKGHENSVLNDRRSVRMLSSRNGKLVMTSSYDYIVPRNTAYMALASSLEQYVDEYELVSKEEYEQGGVEAVSVIADTDVVDVYAADGRCLKTGVRKSDVPALGSGIFIIRSGSSVQKLRIP